MLVTRMEPTLVAALQAEVRALNSLRESACHLTYMAMRQLAKTPTDLHGIWLGKLCSGQVHTFSRSQARRSMDGRNTSWRATMDRMTAALWAASSLTMCSCSFVWESSAAMSASCAVSSLRQINQMQMRVMIRGS